MSEADRAVSDVKQRISSLSPEKRALLEQQLVRRGQHAAALIPRQKSPGPWPLSFSQQRLWFLDQWAPGEPTYNAVLAMRLSGPLRVRDLHRSLVAIIERHEALRTIFVALDGAPRQEVLGDWSFDLPAVDLRSVDARQRERDMLRLVRVEARRPFDLAADLMLRATLIQMAADEHVLVLVEHHIAFDGWSDGELFRELEELYAAFGEKRSPRLPELPIQYSDFAVWQRERMQGDLLERHLSYWRRQLSGAAPCLPLPLDRPRPALQRFAGVHHHFALPPVLSDEVRRLSGQEGATPFMTLLASFALLLHRWSGHDDILVGSPIANRTHVELDHLIGFFSNTLVLRLPVRANPTFRELVRRAREVALGAYEHQELPFEKVVEAIRPPRDPSYNPLFQVNFRVQSSPPDVLTLPGLETFPLNVDMGFSRFDLALEVQLDADAFTGYFEYNEALFEGRTIEGLAERYGALLAEALAAPDEPVRGVAFDDGRPGAYRGARPVRGIRGARGRQ